MNEILNLLWEFWNVLAVMGPYLLFGFFVAGLLSVVLSPRLIEKHLGGEGLTASLKASAFGVPLPLCSCGVIPVSASLRRHGAGRGPTTAFLVSTPQTGVDSILVTWSLLGPFYAIYRPIVALLSGLAGGWLVGVATRKRTGATIGDARATPEDNGGASHDDMPADSRSRRAIGALKYGFVALPEDIGRALLVGIAIAAVIGVFVPADRMPGVLSGGVTAMLLLMLAGIPVYVCATASVPIAAALIAKGVSPGAAMAFLMTGPATNAATIATIWKVMGRRTALLYLLTVAAAALGFGLLLDWIFAVTALDPAPAVAHHHEHVAWWQHAAGLGLLAVLCHGLIHKRFAGRSAEDRKETNAVGEQTVVLSVEGMTCTHCRSAVQRALDEAPGVTSADVDLQKGQATVRGASLEAEALAAAVRGLGYEASVVTDS